MTVDLPDVLPLDMDYTAEVWAAQFEATLNTIPPLLEHMRKTVYRLSAAPIRDRVTGGGFKAGVPFRGGDEEQFLVDQADDLWGRLVDYASDVAGRFRVAELPALTDTWMSHNGAHGLRASTTTVTVKENAEQVVSWLVRMLPAITALEDTSSALEISEQGIRDAVRAYGGQYGFYPRPRFITPPTCDVCGYVVVVEWVARPDGDADGFGVCPPPPALGCGQQYATPGYLERQESMTSNIRRASGNNPVEAA